MRTQKPALLLLDAGNTLVFLDHGALSEAARHAGLTVEASALARAEPLAKRRYENAMKEGVSHEEGWTLHMRANFELAGLSVAVHPPDQPGAVVPSLRPVTEAVGVPGARRE